MTAAAGRADETASASPSAETVETFRAFRRALVLKFKTPDRLESEAFDFIYDSVNAGVERRAVLAATRNVDLRPALGGGAVSADDPALLRAYLDARRGMCPPPATTRENDRTPRTTVAARVTMKLVNDAEAFVTAAGANHRVCESIDASDVLVAMRRFDPPVPGVRELSVAECRAYVRTWDSSDYVHRKRDAWHVHDFNRFARFADAETDAREGASDFVGARGEAASASRDAERRAKHAAETVRRQAADRIEEKKKAAFREARRARRKREGEALVKCLREEMAVYATQRAPAVGGVDAPHAFEVRFEPGRGCVGRLTPEPTLALALAATDVAPGGVPRASGYATPSEARLALAQCRVAITALEAATLGDHLARVGARPRAFGGTSTSFSTRWDATACPGTTARRRSERGRRARRASWRLSTWRVGPRMILPRSCCGTSPPPRSWRSGRTPSSRWWMPVSRGSERSRVSSPRSITSWTSRAAAAAAAAP